VNVPAAQAAAEEAVAIARAAKAAAKARVELAAAPVVNGKWSTAMKIDPFKVPLADKAQFLLDLWPLVKDVPHVKFATAAFEALGEDKIFMSTEGSRVEQSLVRVWPSFTVTAVGTEGQFESRRAEHPPWQGGWDYVTGLPLKKNARAVAEDAVRKLKSPSVTPGKMDLVLAPSNLWLTIHESVGHPTELDRALLLEANLAGTSFVTPDKTGKLKYASPIVTLYADKTTPGGLASCGWDDDGVKTQRWDLVKDGLFVGWQTTREQAGWIGEKESRGTSYAQDHASVAFQRMPNVSLAPSSRGTSMEDLVAATDDGVLVTGDGSWSIDHQRYNFQFSGQMFHEIKGGKITGTLRDVAYQSTSPEFWTSCDMIAGEKTWELHGTLWDGKGEPGQANAVSHGCPAARFRGVNILNVNARGKA
jgi:TldD protein